MNRELLLLADDEPNIVELARLYLEREGFRTAAVGDGQAALDALERELPALLVLDLMLPRVDGDEVCRRVRASPNPALAGLLTAVGERLQPRAAEKSIALSVDIGAGLPVISGDADRLAQVLNNLLDNALRHTPAGGRVSVTAGPSPDGALVEVTDTGAGIPADDLGRIFERFYQVDKSRSRPGGLGLGLAISREIVLAHRGTIEAESVVGLGTRFTIRLPRARLEDGPSAARS